MSIIVTTIKFEGENNMNKEKLNFKEKMEIVVNAGLQMIPSVGGALSTLYFGYKQEQRFKRVEKTLKEVANELNGDS
jgi:hypothetical protein